MQWMNNTIAIAILLLLVLLCCFDTKNVSAFSVTSSFGGVVVPRHPRIGSIGRRPTRNGNTNLLLLKSVVRSNGNDSNSNSSHDIVSIHAMDITMINDDDDDTNDGNTQTSDNKEVETTAGLLADIWRMVNTAIYELNKNEELSTVYPNLQEDFAQKPGYLNCIINHLNTCKDVCYNFGINCQVLPLLVDIDISDDGTRSYKQVESNQENLGQANVRVVGFTVKSYAGLYVDGGADSADAAGAYEFGDDPFWTDDEEEWEIDPALLEDDDDEFNDFVHTVPDNDEEIMDVTKVWVRKMMSDMGVCPFTSGADMAGLPMGKVFYTLDRTNLVESLYERYWNEVVRLEQSTERDLSTTLLICPNYSIQNIEMFENFSNTLTQPLEPLKLEDLIQLVFFHPTWTFRDGGERAGPMAAANYARRSPWPMINILRTKQVRTAQRGIPTGLVYQQNEKTLSGIGSEDLERMLRERDWKQLEDVTVNRKDYEALRIAEDLQTGSLNENEENDLAFDPSVTANKGIDANAVQSADMVKVVLQALQKRLDTDKPLSGPETSVTVMAADYLIKALEEVSN